MPDRRKRSIGARTLALLATTALAVWSCTDGGGSTRSAIPQAEPEPLELTGSDSITALAEQCLSGGQPLPRDDELVLGRLDNGLTYYARSNDVPAGHLDLRLVAKAGGLADPPGAEGTAHFVEHMLFNGTERFPRNELHQALRDIGVEFGPDENAFTSYDSTVYILSISTSGNERLVDKVPVAFEILSEWASSATISDSEVAAERGIVQNELDLRDGSALGHVGQATTDLMFEGTPYEGNRVSGTAASLAEISPAQLRQFYDTWYVPSNMAVIAVGDLDVDELERHIERHFRKLRPGDSDPSQEVWTAPVADSARFAIAVHPDVGSPYATVSWMTPAWAQGTACGEALRVLDRLLLSMLNARLSRAHEAGTLSQANPPIVRAEAPARWIRYYSAELQGLSLGDAVTDFWSAVTGTAAHPFSDVELAQALTSIRAQLADESKRRQSRSDFRYAQDFADHFVGGKDLRGADDWHAGAAEVLHSTSLEGLNRYHQWVIARAQPVVVAAGSGQSALPSTDELASSVASAAPATPTPIDAVISELMKRPDAVEPVGSRQQQNGSRTIHEWTFPNGARVVYEQGNSMAGSVHFLAESRGGLSQLPPGSAALAPFALEAVTASGVGDLSASQVRAQLEEADVQLTPFIEHTAEGFFGSINDAGLETLFAYIHLLLTEPRVSETAARGAQQNARNSAAEMGTSATRQARAAYASARFGDDEYFRIMPTDDEIGAMSADGLLKLYSDRFVGTDDLVVALTGNVANSRVRELSKSYVGTLPARTPDSGVDRRPPHPDGPTRMEVTADTLAESGLEHHFELPTDLSPKLVATSDVLTAILNEHLVQWVREDLGQTYAVYIRSFPQYRPVPSLYAYISATGPSDAMSAIEQRIDDVTRQLASEGPSIPDLEQAIGIVANDAHFGGRLFPPYLLMMREAIGHDNVPWARSIEDEVSDISTADVRDLARRLLDSSRRIEVVRVPRPADG